MKHETLNVNIFYCETQHSVNVHLNILHLCRHNHKSCDHPGNPTITWPFSNYFIKRSCKSGICAKSWNLHCLKRQMLVGCMLAVMHQTVRIRISKKRLYFILVCINIYFLLTFQLSYISKKFIFYYCLVWAFILRNYRYQPYIFGKTVESIRHNVIYTVELLYL
jgi:hypothetical protein